MIGKNNPFNIRYDYHNHWIGLCYEPSTQGFCNFSTRVYGIRAAAIIVLRSYRIRGIKTIEQVISTFAPSSENDTVKYIKYVCSYIGSFPFDEPLTKHDFYSLLCAMSNFEGNSVHYNEIRDVCERFGIVPYYGRKK